MDRPIFAAVAAGALAAFALAGCCNRSLRESVADSIHAVRDGIVDGPTAVQDLLEDSWHALAARLGKNENVLTF